MSPEQIGMDEVDQRSDIYQLGLILYEILSGELPFSNETSTINLLLKRISDRPKKISVIGVKIPRFLEFGISKAMAREKRDRFLSIDEMISYFEKECYPFMGKTLSRVKNHPVISASLILSVTLFFIAALYIGKNSRKIGSIDFSGSEIRVSNIFGVEMFKKDFKPYTVLKSVPHRISRDFSKLKDKLMRDNYLASDKVAIAVFLIKKNLYKDIIEESVKSDKFASAVYLVDNSGKTLLKTYFHLTKTFLLNNEFSGWMNFQNIKKADIDGDGDKELIFETCQNMSMFPTQFSFLDDKSLHTIYSPGNFNLIKAQNIKGAYDFLISGINNPLCHMNFISEIDMKKNDRTLFPPNFNYLRNGLKVDYFYVIIPKNIKVIEDQWKESGKIRLFDIKENSEVTVFRDNTLKVTKKGKTLIYHDNPALLGKTYDILNKVYQKKILEKNYKKAYEIIRDFNFSVLKNPYLLSVLYYFKGDLEIAMGEYKKGEESMKESIGYYMYNMDAIQRKLEILFLKGDYTKYDAYIKNFPDKIYNFYGLGRDGIRIFSTYFNLNRGCFRKSEKISKLLKKRDDILKGTIDIFKGKYSAAFNSLKKMIGMRTTPFTLEETRLIFARSVLLKDLFSKKDNKVDSNSLKLCKFYFKDLADNSFLNNHLSEISASWFMTETEDREDILAYTKEKFEKLLKISKGDMMTRLWLFYDAFIYAKVMEKFGNNKEVIRGYRICIKSNPHTDLSRRAKKVLEKL